jgi:hypothetical protein
MRRPSIFIFALIAATSIAVTAQTKPANSETAKAANDKAAAAIEAERQLKERRANAQSLLINLAADARNFNDPTVRARTQARIADALWDTDRERSKTMLRSAFDAAEAGDAESLARMQEDIRQQRTRNGGGGYVLATPPNLRREVLDFAAKRDQKLAEEFLVRYRDQKARETDERGRRNSGVDEATAQRFSVAEDILEAGDVAKALEFAGPALNSISMSSIEFLSRLRDKDSGGADQRYAALLQSAPMNSQADANTVSILASYIFTPHLYITFRGNGTSSSSMGATPPANVSPELRAAFFRVASAILLRRVPEQSTAGADGQYLMIRRMMPLFEQFAPAETTAALKVQLESLSAMASNSARNRDDEYLHRGISPEPETDKKGDREQALLDQADHAKTSAERDQTYLQLARLMVDKDDRRARDYVDKIEDMELRDAARGYFDASIAYKVVFEKKNVDRALELARNGELTHLQRSWLLSQTANLIGVKDRDGAAQVIEDAAAEARRIEPSDPDRPRALLAVANVVLRINRQGVWEIMDDAIRAANAAEKFTGEDGEITFRLISKGSNSIHQHGVEDFDVAGIFVKLADADYDKAVDLARGFKGEAPRANAVIAIARSVLNEKKK